jgi:hypothetical protein
MGRGSGEEDGEILPSTDDKLFANFGGGNTSHRSSQIATDFKARNGEIRP